MTGSACTTIGFDFLIHCPSNQIRLFYYVNIEKPKLKLITTPQKRLHLQHIILHLTYNNEILKNVENGKVLGVHIDNNLTWTVYTEFIAKKIASNL